jgi:hypothetical protein
MNRLLKLRNRVKTKACLFLLCLLLVLPQFSAAAPAIRHDKPENLPGGGWDPNKYISIDQVERGMKAYCLTVYNGTEVEKFDLEVLSVVRNLAPGRNAILVQGTDERFVRAGPIGGCSGSPVYIQGRLAGALAFGYFFSKDAFYGVTPIEEMLRAGQAERDTVGSGDFKSFQPGFSFDFSTPLDLVKIDAQIVSGWSSAATAFQQNTISGVPTMPLPCPLITSPLPPDLLRQLSAAVEPLGFTAIPAFAADTKSQPHAASGRTDPCEPKKINLEPGACLAVPLATGDIRMDIIGTVTAVEGSRILGFGHNLLGYGPIDLPMATAQVHTVVGLLTRSFKFATSLDVVGALTIDESTAVVGQLGRQPKMIPMTVTVSRYNDPQIRTFNCRLADNRILTPIILRVAAAASTLMLGPLPPDHVLEYQVSLKLAGAEPITFHNVSTGVGLAEMLTEATASVAILMNNPFEQVSVESISFDVAIAPKNITAKIWSVDLSSSTLKQGQNLDVAVVVQTYLAEKKKYNLTFKIPDQLPPGDYNLILCGGYDYLNFLRTTADYKFMTQNITSLIGAMNNILAVRRDKLYCLLVLPQGGLAVERAELPDLPPTKALILQSPKRTIKSQPYPHWLEETVPADAVIIDQKNLRITVEKP